MDGIPHEERSWTDPVTTQILLLRKLYDLQLAEIERKKAFDTAIIQWHKVAVEEQKQQTKILSQMSMVVGLAGGLMILGAIATLCFGVGLF
jgi:hypothetical protein